MSDILPFQDRTEEEVDLMAIKQVFDGIWYLAAHDLVDSPKVKKALIHLINDQSIHTVLKKAKKFKRQDQAKAKKCSS